MNHNAIYALYPQVVMIHDKTGAFDKDGNKVDIDPTLVNAWVDPDEYKYQRAKEYPPITEQLDKIFHDGIEEWKKEIQAVKDKYPKGE